MLNLSNVNSHYGDLQALRNVTLQIDRGQIVSIVGSNGAGKTTMINTISGIIACSSGLITFMGEQIHKTAPHRIVEKGVVQVPEGRLLFPYMDVLENLELGAFNSRSRHDLKQTLNQVLEYFPKLKDRIKQLAGTLSGGEQQMLAIGRGLMAKPMLLMLDEPSLGLSPLIVKEMFETVKAIRDQGITVLLIEQNVLQSLLISDWAYVLENGSIILEGTGRDLLNDPRVKNAYLGI